MVIRMQKSYFLPRVSHNTASGAGNGIELTLFELDSAVQGTFYDLFTGDFFMDEGETTARYSIQLSLKTPSEAVIEGEVIDKTRAVVTKIPRYQTDAGNKLARHIVTGEINHISGDVSLHVRAEYTASNGVLQTPELILPLMWISPSVIHTLVHPTKRKSGEPVRRYGNHTPSYHISCGSPEPDYVVTVLDCDVNNDSNVDYICRWGNAQSSYRPYFGIPGEGSVTGPKNGTLDLEAYPPVATCIATSRDKSMGGAMLLAGGNSIEWTGDIDAGDLAGATDLADAADPADAASYETKPGDITFSRGASKNILKYQFVGAWNNGTIPLDNPDWSREKYFDYTLRMTIPFKLQDKEVHRYSIIVSSIPQTSKTALVDNSVLPVKVMFDCFAKGSRVLTPGGEVLVETIKAGDVVSTADGERVVSDVLMSAGCQFLTIAAAGFGTLSLTPDHAVLTEAGFVAAGSLKPGDRVMTRGGKAVIETITEHFGEVYSLNVAGFIVGGLYVNGFIVGGGV